MALDELRVDGLRVACGARTLVDGVSLRIGGGELVALVGSSGSGKTVTARALVGMLPFRPGRIGGTVTVTARGRTVRPTTEAEFRTVRGDLVGMLWQDARGALDPLRRIAAQVREAARLAGDDGEPPEAWLSTAGFSDPGRVARLYPHELSGGMAQRAAIAIALARRSAFLLADEPTTGLDPSVQQALLRELRALCARGVGVLLITHDLRILPDLADRVVVMDAGRILEEAATPAELAGPGRALFEATRRVAGGAL
jgi:ABC-type glutathione transport system ATPase component